MARRTWEVRGLLVLVFATPLLSVLVFGPPRVPPEPAQIGPEPGAGDVAQAELRAFAKRAERFSALTVKETVSGRFVVFLQTDAMLFMYVPCRYLDKPARDRLAAVLREREPWHGAPSQLGDFVLAWLDDPDWAAEVMLRVFVEVYRIGPGYRLVVAGDRESAGR
jgi:hypothetical protein